SDAGWTSSGLVVRGRGLFARGDRAIVRTLRELFEVAACACARASAPRIGAAGGSRGMHTDLTEKIIARRLRGASDQPGEAPYDWAEFQRRRGRSMLTRTIERNRPAAIAAAIAATVLVAAIPYLRATHSSAPRLTPLNTTAANDVSDRQEQARTRAI